MLLIKSEPVKQQIDEEKRKQVLTFKNRAWRGISLYADTKGLHEDYICIAVGYHHTKGVFYYKYERDSIRTWPAIINSYRKKTKETFGKIIPLSSDYKMSVKRIEEVLGVKTNLLDFEALAVTYFMSSEEQKEFYDELEWQRIYNLEIKYC